MKIFILLLIILGISLICRDFISLAKRNIFKNQAAWSGKDIKIKYNASKEVSTSKKDDNYLKMIAEESKTYLEEHSKKKEN